MYWQERVSKIYEFLNKNGYSNTIDAMIDQHGLGGTPGEQFSIVCMWLAKMRNHDPELYSVLRQDADEILKEGIEIGYFTESYYNSL